MACGRRGAGTELRHGLGILKFGRNSPDGTGEWAVSVWFTVLFMVVCLVMAVIAMVADRFVSRTYEFVLTAMATVLSAVEQMWQLAFTVGAMSDTTGYGQPGSPAEPPQDQWG